MNGLGSRQLWQVSGGPDDRNYAELFLEHGVALIGPGDAGPRQGGPYVRRFADEIQPGDAILLRTGASAIRAIGLVTDEYQYLSQFDDVNGWDLQHARRVRWFALPEPQHFKERVFGANPPRVARVNRDDLRAYTSRFLNSPPQHWQTAPLPPLPPDLPSLLPDDVPPSLRDLVAQAQDLGELYWQETFGDPPNEYELVAHYVVPLLRASGWSVEQIAVEWRNVDVALFGTLPRAVSNCRFLIEAKRRDQGIEGALKQAMGYHREHKMPDTTHLIVTDGIRYRLYEPCVESFRRAAYANLARLKRPALDFFARIKRA